MARKTFKKVITSDEKTALINKDNIKLVERFLKDKGQRSGELTIANYRSDLLIFLTWNLEYNNNKHFTDIKKIEFSDFFGFCLEDLQWGSARFSRMRSTLSSFSNFIEKFYDEDYPKFRSVILKVIENLPKQSRREKTIFSDDQVNQLLNWLKIDKPQEALWVALAISSGARFAEILRFTVDIIDENHTAFQNIFIECLKPIKTKGRTKQGKMLTKYIIKDFFFPYYKAWLPVREKIMKENGQEHNSIFIKPDGSPAEEGTVRSWINRWEAYMKINIYPHAFRHFTTTYLSKVGLPYNLIKEIFGWESVDMVSRYDDVSAKDKSWSELENLKNDLENKN